MSSAKQLSKCTHGGSINISHADIEVCKKKSCKCSVCHNSGANQWLCLTCQFVGCGPKVKDHSNEHFKTKNHPLVINLKNMKIYCNECDSQVFPGNNSPPLIIPESNCPNSRNRITMSASPMSPSLVSTHHEYPSNSSQAPPSSHNYPTYIDEDYDEDKQPVGLTGLKNLGNTCYMNAGLQALSNCPQLTTYFLECSDLITTDKKPMLSLHYRKLLSDVWNKRRLSYIIPSGICAGIKQVHPMFRGFAQQDSQEFLRCFMDQLHEELKAPVMCPSSCESESDDVDNYSDSGVSLSGSYSNRPRRDSQRSSKSFYGDCDSLSFDSGHDNQTNPANHQELSRTTSSCNKRSRPQSNEATYRQQDLPRKKAKPHQESSIISEIFNGKLLSSVQCLTCERVSSTKEIFQDLSLPIFTRDNSSFIPACNSVSIGNSTASSSDLRSSSSNSGDNPGDSLTSSGMMVAHQGLRLTRLIFWMYNWMKSWFVGPTITLQDCLAAFFSEDELKGDNMYSCEKCSKLRNGIKSSRLLQLPEILCIHLKRFRHNFNFSTKISNYVSFPIDGLDMSPYLHKDCKDTVTTYDLTAVVCHQGTAGGGHYTAYALNQLNQTWYEFDDEEVSQVDVNAVANCEAYILFYRKNDEKMFPIRNYVDNLIQMSENDSLYAFYLSRSWITRFNTWAEPGPITNSEFLCKHGAVLPSKANLNAELAVEVSQQVWKYLINQFGGGPAVTHMSACQVCQEQENRLKERQKTELNTVSKLHEIFRCDPNPPTIYAVSMTWFKEWENFARMRESEPPGNINNTNIVVQTSNGEMVIRTNSEYGRMSRETWLYLHSIYGGGPEVCLKDESDSPDESWDGFPNGNEKEMDENGCEEELESHTLNSSESENAKSEVAQARSSYNDQGSDCERPPVAAPC